MLRDREQELCHICAVVHAEVSAVALIALVLMTCYLEVMCISVSVGVLYVPNWPDIGQSFTSGGWIYINCNRTLNTYKLVVKPLKDIAQLRQFKFMIWMPTASVNYSYSNRSIQI